MDNYIGNVNYFLDSINNVDKRPFNKTKITQYLFSIFDLEYFINYEPKIGLFNAIIKYLEIVNNKKITTNKFVFYMVSKYKLLYQQIFIGLTILFSSFDNIVYFIDELSIINRFIKTPYERKMVFIEYNHYNEKLLNTILGDPIYLIPKVGFITNDNEKVFYNKTCFSLNNSSENNEIKNVSFTFDDGPHPIYTPHLLDVLKKRNIKATFFLLGEKICMYPEIAKRIHLEGHEIGNHGWDHKSFFSLSHNQMTTQLKKTSLFIKKITGKNPTYFRPPYGHTNHSINNIVFDKLNLQLNLGNLFLQDSNIKDITVIADYVINNIDDGDIIIGHDTSFESVEAFTNIFNRIEHKYDCLLLSDLLCKY
jgi:peptidoglycan/xylan/chitin deacetylase (PgdA/CDA1 family)